MSTLHIDSYPPNYLVRHPDPTPSRWNRRKLLTLTWPLVAGGDTMKLRQRGWKPLYSWFGDCWWHRNLMFVSFLLSALSIRVPPSWDKTLIQFSLIYYREFLDSGAIFCSFFVNAPVSCFQPRGCFCCRYSCTCMYKVFLPWLFLVSTDVTCQLERPHLYPEFLVDGKSPHAPL